VRVTKLSAHGSYGGFLQPAQVVAHGDAVGRGGTGHVAIDANPVGRSVRAVALELVGAGELGSEPGELEL
jgi:hypothetical protein